MKNSRITKCCLIAAAIAILAVFTAAPVGARELNWKLKGDYALTSTGACAFASAGFVKDPETGKWGRSPLANPAWGMMYNYAIQGVFSFDGHGGFTFNGEALHIFPDPYSAPPYPTYKYPANDVIAEGTGEYAVNDEANGLFVVITFDSLKFTNETMIPPLALTVKGANFRGRLDTFAGAGIVFLSSTDETPQNVSGTYQYAQRICNGTGNMVKLSPRKNWFSKE